MGSVGSGESTRLEQVLINTDQTDNVTSGDIVNWLNEATHHENGTLDSLDNKVLLLAREVVGSLDADLQTGADGTRVDTTESIETALIGGRHHLGNVQHERSLGIALADTIGALIVHGTFVEGLNTVLLGSNGRRKVKDDHLQEGVGSGEELAHHDLQEGLALELPLISGQLDLELLDELADIILFGVSDSVEHLEDGVQDKLVEGTLELLALVLTALGPLLGLGVEVVVAL